MKLFSNSLEKLLSFSCSPSHTLIHTWHCLIRSAAGCLVELQAENIRNTLEQEMVFFARLIGGFQVADEITPIKIDNYDK
jgi:3-phosphoglycerate kinase